MDGRLRCGFARLWSGRLCLLMSVGEGRLKLAWVCDIEYGEQV